LGGQNFLEPLVSGIRPVIGPWWESFHWVGSDIVDSGLVRVARNWKEAADRLARDISSPPDPQQTRRRAQSYVQQRQGGTAASCRRIAAMLAVSQP
jgi:3-deoxy-D-manno-octulosonic-acid transferase